MYLWLVKNSLHLTDSLPGRFIETGGQTYLWFSGTSYLGMPHQPDFQASFAENIYKFGMSWGSSRNNTIRLSVYEEAEIRLAQFFKKEAALTVSSGMMAGQLTQYFLQSQGYEFIYAPKTHPALWHQPNMNLSGDYSLWASQLTEKINQNLAQKIAIFSDLIGSPFVEKFDLSWMESLPQHKQIVVVIDASHGLGIMDLPQNSSNHQLLITSSLNKAMGMAGGLILGENKLINALKTSPIFAGASPMMPALLGTFLDYESGFIAQKQQLLTNIAHFQRQLISSKLAFVDNYPAYCTYQKGIHEYLTQNGIMTACFAYPKADDLPVTRLVISALHTIQDLDLVATLCNDFE